MMKLSDLIAPSTTTLELVDEATKEPVGVTLTGHTPDSSEWKKLAKKYATKNDTVIVKKDGTHVPIDSKAADKQRSILIESITNIEGISGWKFSEEKRDELLGNHGCQWILDQWKAHVDVRGNYWGKSESPAEDTSAA